MSKTDLWDRLGKTDPTHTKSFKRAGGFSGTAIKPMWAYRRMTEEFGPCGKGWGVNAPSFEVVQGPEGEVLVYCTASIWWESPEQISFGVGGDKAVGKNKHGLSGDDEAFKKAFTDAITNALKMIGIGADVHMGLFDDNKYVNTMRDEYAGKDQTQKPPSKSKSREPFDFAVKSFRAAPTKQALKDAFDAVDWDAMPKDWASELIREKDSRIAVLNSPTTVTDPNEQLDQQYAETMRAN